MRLLHKAWLKIFWYCKSINLISHLLWRTKNNRLIWILNVCHIKNLTCFECLNTSSIIILKVLVFWTCTICSDCIHANTAILCWNLVIVTLRGGARILEYGGLVNSYYKVPKIQQIFLYKFDDSTEFFRKCSLIDNFPPNIIASMCSKDILCISKIKY